MSVQNGYTVLKLQRKKLIIKRLSQKKDIGYYRKGSYSEEIIWQGRKFLFPSPKKSAQEDMWVFRSVMSNVREYLSIHNIRAKERLPVNYWNKKLEKFRGKITATDVDHAYWRIAFLQGIITEKTYKKGLAIRDKSLRLAALANLASTKEYYIIKDGKVTTKSVILKYDPILHKLYNNIRYTCYSLMMELAKMLGDEFICYKTDCIYYIDKPCNRIMVQEYLENHKMMWKQLIEPSRPKKEEADDTSRRAS